MAILTQPVAALLLFASSLPAFAAIADSAPVPGKEKPVAAAAAPAPAPAEPAGDKPAIEPAPTLAPKAGAEKSAPVRQRLAKQISESYLRLKELRETLADLEMAVSTGDTDRAWEHAAQLAILWEALDSKQRISFERRFPGTKARVEKALTQGTALARSAAPRTPVAAKEANKPAADTTLAKKGDEAKPVEVDVTAKE